MCLASRADNSTQVASDLFSSTVHFLLHISRISYFSFFHFLQYNQHVIFFEGNFTRVITCLSSKTDHFQGRSIGQSIFNFAMSRRKKLPQYFVVSQLKDWAYPGSWIGSVVDPAFISIISKPGTILSIICSTGTIICYFYQHNLLGPEYA